MPIYHKCIGKFGYIVRKDKLTSEEEKQLIKDLTVKTTVLPAYRDFQKPQTYRLYFHSNLAYYLPRAYGIETFGAPEYIGVAEGVPTNLECIFSPKPHQVEALGKAEKIFNVQSDTGGGGVLSLPCGYGKTYCSIYIANNILHTSTIVFVTTEPLMDQWMDAIRTFVPKAKVGYIQRDHVDVEGKDFVVAMIHSICLRDYPIETFDRFGFAVFDECHHLGSKMFCKAMMKVRTKYILGLSATPKRRDGLSSVFYKFMGPLFHTQKRSGTNVVCVKKIILHSNSKNYEVIRDRSNVIRTAMMTTEISKLHERNQLIVFLIRQLTAQGRKILIISSRKGQLHKLRDMLDEASIRNPTTGKYITYGFYYGKKGMSRAAHRKLLTESAKCDVVLGIDIIAKEGLDIPDLNTLIFATPAGIEVEQPVGRILRKFHEHLPPMVIDLVDSTGNYKKHSKLRDDWYREEEYTIHEYDVTLKGHPTQWEEGVTDYLQKTKITSVASVSKTKTRVSKSKKEIEPEACMLLLEGEVPKVKAKISKTKAPPIRRKKITNAAPDVNKCLLSGAREKPKPKPKQSKTEPNFDVLHLDEK